MKVLMFDLIRAQLQTSVPFATHVGIELTAIEQGRAVARLAERSECANHIGSVHAGALFTLAEAASGAAMAGALAPVLMTVRPVTARAEMTYRKIARGALEAIAQVDADPADLMARLERDGRCQFPVMVAIRDEAGDEVATLAVEWNAKRTTA